MEKIYIISDVHGCFKSLLALIDKFPNKQNSKIVFVGDLVDRGKNSYDVVEFVINNNYDCVKGNHEELFLDYAPIYGENDDTKYWLYSCGGEATHKSYKNIEDLKRHYSYFEKLPLYIEYKDYVDINGRYLVVSHSTVASAWSFRDSKDKIDQEIFESQVLWSRNRDFDNKDIFNVYGHTIYDNPKITPYSMGIDLGCYHKKDNIKLPNPRLCALEFPSMKIFTQESLE
ncbi:metallophosphoesterase family protein [Aliarcobacter lanthieri]|uniref:metallophosphoesterase family protein n=1 Tax=Aliarcobacter lanthieri TaxID=1355374 RepID=UPI003AABAF18